MGEHTLREVLKRRSEDTLRKIQARRGTWQHKSGKHRKFGWGRALLWLVLLGILALGGYAVYLNQVITTRFEGSRWALPARVFARPLELYPGKELTAATLVRELDRLGYRRADRLEEAGTYRYTGGSVTFITRAFRFWDGPQPSLAVRADFRGSQLVDLEQLRSGEDLYLVRLDPALIGSLFPQSGEDRILVRLEDTPRLLRDMIMQVEDRRFYEHFGLDPKGIARAFAANVQEGEIVQGGSTLTQQLVRSYFLSNAQTLWRKLTEAIMAVEIELHFDKDEIFEAYLNEVYLGQDGPRAIHGFGLASYFYFQKPVAELQLPQMALLVALVKGPSYYDPRRHPERALERRNLVLDVAVERQLITQAQALRAKRQPLGVIAKPPVGTTYYPAYMDLVRQQLQRDYQPEDLTSEGLQIFTTLDPLLQERLEEQVSNGLQRLERSRGLPASTLEGAAVLTSVEGAEVLAMVGGRNARYAGFNRALSAVRPVGSLLKPVVYLTMFEQSDRYTWATPIEDTPLEVQMPDGKVWKVNNYNNEYHGTIPVYQALVHSYNVPTVRVGLDIGVQYVSQTLTALGFSRAVNPYPSLLLGAVSMTPLEVAQVYNTLAAGGFRTRVSAIREVLTKDGVPVQRYPLEVAPAATPRAVYLVNRALQLVVARGTARSAAAQVDGNLNLAGKTGTTDDFRDSWFAGFSGDHVAVVWVGRDDNEPVNLTGSSGALQIWARYMGAIPNQPFRPVKPADVEEIWIDPASGVRTQAGCENAVQLPFVTGSAPVQAVECRGAIRQILQDVFN